MEHFDEEMTVTRLLSGEGWQAEVRQHYLPVTPIEEPDPGWKFTDKAGHAHRYERQSDGTLTTPTLIGGHEQEIDEDGDVWERNYLRCLQCWEEITPGTRDVPRPPLKFRFSGTYKGRVKVSGDNPGFGAVCGPMEVGDYIPGYKGTAQMVLVEASHEQRRSLVRIDFEGVGELVGMNVPIR